LNTDNYSSIMPAQIRCINSGLEDLVFDISKDTLFGRENELPHASIYPTDQLVTVPKLITCVSRNHAVFRLIPGETTRYQVIDLDSTNGTYVNGTRVKSRVLGDGDVIEIGEPKNPKGIKFVFEQIEDNPKNYALLVGVDMKELRGVYPDLNGMHRFIRDRKGFDNNIKRRYNLRAKNEEILSDLDCFRNDATADSLTVFYFSGHGNYSGLKTHDGYLGPIALYSHLLGIKGKKLVILDACHSGIFANEQIVPPETLVLASTRKESLSWERDQASGIKPLYGGDFTTALIQLLSQQRHSFNLAGIEGSLREYYILAQNNQTPREAGTYDFEFPSQKIMF